MRKVACLLHGSMLSDECCFVVAVCCMLLACRKLRLANWKNFAKELFHKVLSGSVVLCREYSEMSFAPWLLRLVWRHEPVRNGSLWKSCATGWRKSWCQQGRLGASKMGFNQICIFATSCMFVAWCGLVRFFPRASERRVLPIVGVCISPSHLHTFSSSHLLIFTSAHLHIFSHICSSSHLLIFISSLTSSLTSSLICSLSSSHLL